MALNQATVGDLSAAEFERRLRGDGLGVRTGPFDLHVCVDVTGLAHHLHCFYRDYPLLEGDRVFSCHVAMRDVYSLFPKPARRVRFMVDGVAPHEDMPADQALAVLEWGINLVIAVRSHRYLMLHAAVLERNGHALVFPAAPGAGKTTLCVALAHRGWRLFSDEFGLVRPEAGTFVPVPRAMPLKNESIEVIREFAPEAVIGPKIANTRKGTVAHVRPPTASIVRANEEAKAAWIVFPQWSAVQKLSIERVSKAEGLLRLATNAFNYETLGLEGFEAARRLVDESGCYRLHYSDLNEAVAMLTAMADDNVR